MCFSSLSVQAALSIPHLALLFIFLALIEGRFRKKKKKEEEKKEQCTTVRKRRDPLCVHWAAVAMSMSGLSIK